jgi:cell division transport system permease protein
MFTLKLKRVTKTGFINFWRNGTVTIASMLILMVTLFTVGSLVLSGAILDSLLGQIKDRVDINVYFKTNASQSDIQGVQKALAARPEVKEITFTSADDALAQFKARHQDNTLIIGSLSEINENPLGAVLNIKAKDPSQYESISKFLSTDAVLSPGGGTIIDKVNYNQNKLAIDRLSKVIDMVQKVGFLITILFSILAIVVTVNTIRLAIYTAREEIGVMKLVGASNNYIRGPFVVQGAMNGILAAVLVMIILYPLAVWVGNHTDNFFGGLNVASYFLSNFFQLFGILLATGIVLSVISSFVAVGRYLKV